MQTILKTAARIAVAAALLIATPNSQAFGGDWEAINIPVKEAITGIFFVNPDTGFVVTVGGKFGATYDGAKNWLILQVTPNVPLEDIYFLDSQNGFVCGRNGTILSTTDGGRSWQSRSYSDTLVWLFDIEMLDRQTGLVIGATREPDNRIGGLALRSTDGGKKWNKIEAPGLGYSEIFAEPGSPVRFLSYGQLNISKDMGKSWSSTLTIEGNPCRCLSFFGTNGIMGGVAGECAYTADGGRTWTKVKQKQENMFIAAQMISAHEGYLAGLNSTILHTLDGGRTWNVEAPGQTVDLYDLFLIGSRLYGAGSDGIMIYTELEQETNGPNK